MLTVPCTFERKDLAYYYYYYDLCLGYISYVPRVFPGSYSPQVPLLFFCQLYAELATLYFIHIRFPVQ